MSKNLPSGRHVAPSILSADFSRLGDQVSTVLGAGAKVIHVDVMDGHFVPPITIGPIVVDALDGQVHESGGFLDVHLMIEEPERQIEAFAKAGADNITVHYEATSNVHSALMKIREYGCSSGLALKPETPVEHLEDLAGVIDVALCMSVNPGWGGQPFIEASIEKIKRMRELLPDDVSVEVDGGIDVDKAPDCAKAGAELFVAGSAIFSKEDPADAYKAIARAIEAG